jgi:hypothetical protein
VSGSGHGMPCPDVAAASRYAAPRRRCRVAVCPAPRRRCRVAVCPAPRRRCRVAVCPAPTSLPQRGMPRPDVAAASRYAAPRRRCRVAVCPAPRRRCRVAVCRAPTSLPQRGMPRPDVAAATRYAAPRRRCRVGITSGSADGAASGFMRRLQYFSDTLTLVRIYRVAPGVRFQQGVDRNYGF